MTLVRFNEKQDELFKGLKEAQLVSVDFSTFVKNAFHKEIDRLTIEAKGKVISVEQIEKIAENVFLRGSVIKA